MPRRRIAAGQPRFDGRLEQHAGIGRDGEPGVLRDLLLELSRRPAGVAQRHEHVLRALAARDRLEHVLRRREADVVVDGERGLPVAERPVQHEPAVDLDGTAEMHRHAAQLGVRERDVDLLEQRGERHVGRLVDDDAERAFRTVLADVGERVRKMRVRHRRHGDQEMMREIGGSRPDGVTHGCNCKRGPLWAQLAPRRSPALPDREPMRHLRSAVARAGRFPSAPRCRIRPPWRDPRAAVSDDGRRDPGRALVWFRRDLRAFDHAALYARARRSAAKSSAPSSSTARSSTRCPPAPTGGSSSSGRASASSTPRCARAAAR